MTQARAGAPPLGPGALILASGSLPQVSFEERVAAAAQAGFDGIGLAVWEYARLLDCGYTPDGMRRTLSQHGLRLAELEVVLGFAVSGAAADTEPIPGVRYTDAATLAMLFEMAEVFGARHLQAVGTFGTEVLEDDAAERFAALCDQAAAHGLLVALEFVPGTNVPDAMVANRIVSAAGRPNGGICVDSWHHFRGAADWDLLAGVAPDRVFLIQLDDGPAAPADPDFLIDTMTYREPPGLGQFDLDRFLRTLWDIGARAPVSVEILSKRLAQRPAAETAQAIADATRKLVKAARSAPRPSAPGVPAPGPSAPDSVTLVPLARVSVAAGARHQIDSGPFGNRIIAAISEGRWEGDRLKGRIVGAGGDWAMPGPGDAMLLDVRQVIETDDGAIIYVSYNGRHDRSRGTYTVAPTFETADPRYTWLNAVQAVGKGRYEAGRLNYEMFEVR